MKKSPLSTPSGSRGRHGFGWKSHSPHKNRTGYGSVRSDSYQCIPSSGSQMKYGEEFLPLNVSTPGQEQKNWSGNWYGSSNQRQHRYSASGGYNNYRNNYHTTPKSNHNNSYSPYKYSGKPFQGPRKAYQKDAHRHIDISNYIDMRSFLEDPWADLMKKLDNLQAGDSVASSKAMSPMTLNSYRNATRQSLNDSEFSQESKQDSSFDVSLGLDDSTVSKADSSIDLQFDTVNVNSEDSEIEKDKCTNESNSKDDKQEDLAHHTEPDIPRVST